MSPYDKNFTTLTVDTVFEAAAKVWAKRWGAEYGIIDVDQAVKDIKRGLEHTRSLDPLIYDFYELYLIGRELRGRQATRLRCAGCRGWKLPGNITTIPGSDVTICRTCKCDYCAKVAVVQAAAGFQACASCYARKLGAV